MRTAFNLMRPARQPGAPRRQLMGVPDRGRGPAVADVLQALGIGARVRGPRRPDRRAAPRRQRRHLRRLARRRRAPRRSRRADTRPAASPTRPRSRAAMRAANAAIIEAILDGRSSGPATRCRRAQRRGRARRRRPGGRPPRGRRAGAVDTIDSGAAAALRRAASGPARPRGGAVDDRGRQLADGAPRARPARVAAVGPPRDRRAPPRGHRRASLRRQRLASCARSPRAAPPARATSSAASPRPGSTSSRRSSAARRPPGALADGGPRRRGPGPGLPGRWRRAIISVLVEPHWFGGSIDDLRAARAATTAAGARQGVRRGRAAAAAAAGRRRGRGPAARRAPSGAPTLARLVREALDLGLEPLVEAHDARELDAALATDARLIGINNRDLRTLAVDPETWPPGCASASRPTGSRSPSPGVRDAATLRRWRALGFDAALVGEELMRSGADPAAVTRAGRGARGRRRGPGHPARTPRRTAAAHS